MVSRTLAAESSHSPPQRRQPQSVWPWAVALIIASRQVWARQDLHPCIVARRHALDQLSRERRRSTARFAPEPRRHRSLILRASTDLRRFGLWSALLTFAWLCVATAAALGLARRVGPPAREPTPEGFEAIRFSSRSCIELGAFVGEVETPSTAIVLVNGYGASRSAFVREGCALRALGHTVLALSVRGHGDSGGVGNDFEWSARQDVGATVLQFENRLGSRSRDGALELHPDPGTRRLRARRSRRRWRPGCRAGWVAVLVPAVSAAEGCAAESRDGARRVVRPNRLEPTDRVLYREVWARILSPLYDVDGHAWPRCPGRLRPFGGCQARHRSMCVAVQPSRPAGRKECSPIVG